MRKSWIYKRENLKGWWTGWYESGKRKAKACPTKNLAEHVDGLRETSIYEDMLTLGPFKRIVGPNSSKEITQQGLDTFVLKRSDKIQKTTLNKDIRNVNAFLN